MVHFRHHYTAKEIERLTALDKCYVCEGDISDESVGEKVDGLWDAWLIANGYDVEEAYEQANNNTLLPLLQAKRDEFWGDVGEHYCKYLSYQYGCNGCQGSFDPDFGGEIESETGRPNMCGYCLDKGVTA